MTESVTPPPAGPPRMGALARVLTFIRFSHTVFALPFALGAMFVAARGWPAGRPLGLVIVEMVFARTAAMTFNRLADWEIDKLNPRTAGRHKLVSRGTAIGLLVISAGGFVGTAAFINRICLLLSPVALAILFFLLADEAVHGALTFLPRAGAGDFTDRSVAGGAGAV